VEYTSIFTNFSYTKDNNKAYYIQLADFIKDCIKNNLIDKLPSERELSSFLSVSRLTIIKSYDILKKEGIINSVKGSGYYINKDYMTFFSSRKGRAYYIINKVIDTLLEEKFSFNDIKNYFNSILAYKEFKRENINIAFVDCNPESFFIVESQIKELYRINTLFYDINAVLKRSNYKLILNIISNFDIIITTKKHYNEINKYFNDTVSNIDKSNLLKSSNSNTIIGNLTEKQNKIKKLDKLNILKVHIEPDHETFIRLDRINKDSKKLVFCYSNRFKIIIKNYLDNLNINKNIEFFAIESLFTKNSESGKVKNKENLDEKEIKGFNKDNTKNFLDSSKLSILLEQKDKLDQIIKDKFENVDFIIIPANFNILKYKEYLEDKFENGNFENYILNLFDKYLKIFSDKLISFNYKIDNGSLIIIEDKINEIESKRLREYINEGEFDEEN